MTESVTPGGDATILPAGTQAPEFALSSAPDHILRLSDLRGRPVILVFYPADWSPVCGDQVALYNEILPEFEALGAQLLGVSVDGPWCMPPAPATASSASRSWRTSSPRAPSPGATASTATATGPASGRWSSSMPTASS